MTAGGKQTRSNDVVKYIVLATLPVLYTLGFLAWATYSVRMGLGFLDLPPSRYLLAGILFVPTLVIMGVLEFVVVPRMLSSGLKETLRQWVWSKAQIYLLRVALFGVGMPITLGLLMTFGGSKAPDGGSVIAVFIWGGLAAGLLFFWPELVYGINRLCASRGEADHPPRPQASGPAPDPNQLTGWVALPAWVILSVVAVGWVMLPSVQPEMGGALPRHAQFAMHPDTVPAGLAGDLFPDGHQDNSDVAWTVNLTIFHESSWGYKVRLEGDDSGRDALFEIAKEGILAVKWID